MASTPGAAQVRPQQTGERRNSAAYSQGDEARTGTAQPTLKRKRADETAGEQSRQSQTGQSHATQKGRAESRGGAVEDASRTANTQSGAACATSSPEPTLVMLKIALESDRKTQVDLLCIWEMLSTPETRNNSVKTASDTPPPDPDGLIHVSPDAPDLFARRPLEVDDRLIMSLKNGFHVPLTMFTVQSIAAVNRHPWELKLEERCDVDFKEVACVDETTWPAEEAMSPVDWREAYPWFLKALPAFLPRVEVDRFRRHFEFLDGQRDFVQNFRAILGFDISVRYRYFHDKTWVAFKPGSAEYRLHLNDESMRILREDLRRR